MLDVMKLHNLHPILYFDNIIESIIIKDSNHNEIIFRRILDLISSISILEKIKNNRKLVIQFIYTMLRVWSDITKDINSTLDECVEKFRLIVGQFKNWGIFLDDTNCNSKTITRYSNAIISGKDFGTMELERMSEEFENMTIEKYQKLVDEANNIRLDEDV